MDIQTEFIYHYLKREVTLQKKSKTKNKKKSKIEF